MAQAADTYFWGGGSNDIANDTPIPLATNTLTGNWSTTTKNWADSIFSPNTYSAWSNGSIASFGYFASGTGPRVKMETDITVGGMVFQSAYFLDPTNVSSPVNLTVNGPLDVFGAVSMSAGVQLAGSSTLWKRGGAEFAIRGNSSAFTGDVLVSEGFLFLDNTGGSGVLTGVTNLTVAPYLVGKTASQPYFYWRFNATNNLSTDLVMTLSGAGAFRPQSQNAGTSHTLGKLVIEGAGILNDQNANNLVTLTFGDATQGLTQGSDGRGVLHVRPVDAAGTMRTTYKVANAGTIPVDTLLPWVMTSRAEFMKLDSASGNSLVTVTATDADNDAANWAGLYDSTSNLRVTNTTLSNSLTGATTINSLGLNVASTLNLGGNTLNVASGGVAMQAATGTVMITNGTLTTDADVLYLGSGTDNAANFTARVGATITGDIDVVKSGFAVMHLDGTNSNTYSGTTYVNYGQLYLSKSGTAVAVPGDLVVRKGGSVLVRATANATNSQFGAASSVTLDNSYLKVEANALMTVGGTLTLDNGYLEVIYNNTATNMLRLTGAGAGFAFNGGVVQHNATIDGTISLLTDVGYGAGSATQARFETVATNGAKLNVALNWGADAGTATRTFDIADSTTLAAGQAEMKVDASLIDGGSGTTKGALRKTGSGVLQLVASNSYTGGTTVEAGTLQISTLSRAAQSNLSGVVSGSTLTFLEPIAGSFMPGQVLNFNGTERVIWSVVDDYRVVVSANPTAGLYSNTITSSNFTRTGSLAGDVAINGGTLRIDNSDNTVGGNLSFGGGALEVGLTNTMDYASKILNSTGAIHIRTTNAQNVTLGALDASNTGGLTKSGNGTLTLNGTNAYTGGTTISAGTLQIGDGGTGGSIDTTSGVTNNGSLVFNRSDNLTASYAIGGTGNITKLGAGTLTLSGTNTYSGGTLVAGGTLQINSNAALGSTNSAVTISNAGVLRVTGAGSIVNSLSIGAGNGVLSNASGGTVNFTGGAVKDGTTLISASGSGTNVFSGVISGASANSDFIVDGGTTVFSNVMTYNGPTIITNGGTLVLAVDDALPSGSNLVLGGGTLLVDVQDYNADSSLSLGTLTLTDDSTIDLGDFGAVGDRNLKFADSSAITWVGTLTITNWQGVAQTSSDVTKLLFGTGGLTSTQLGQIYFANQDITGGVLLGAEGELAPIPEAPVWMGAAAVVLFVGWRERRRIASFLRSQCGPGSKGR